MFNDLVDFLSNIKVGFLSSQETLANSFLSKFCDILWYLDPFHQKFADRGYRVPEKLEKFTGYIGTGKNNTSNNPGYCILNLFLIQSFKKNI